MHSPKIILTVLLFIFIYGCKDDVVINNGGNNPNYTVDSLLYGFDSSSVFGPDTFYVVAPIFTDSTDEGYKVTFTGSTNAISTKLFISFYWINGDTIIDKYGGAIIGDHEHIFDMRQLNDAPLFLHGFLNSHTDTTTFIKLLNLRIYRIKYN